MKKNIILGIIIVLLVIAVAVEGFFLWKQNDDKNKEEGDGAYFRKTYNIDISAKKEIDNEKLLEKVNVTENDLNEKIIKVIENLEMYKRNNDFVKEQKDKSINKYKNISADEISLYINEKNNLCARD